MEPPPPLFFWTKWKISSYYLTFWIYFCFFQNVDIRSRRRNLFWFYVKMHKIQNYSWWSDSKTKITKYWSFSLVKRKHFSQNFQIAKRRKGGGHPRRRPLFGVIGKFKNSTFLILSGVYLFLFDEKPFIFLRRFHISARE